MTRALPFTTLKDISADLATASEAIDDAENVYLDASLFALPHCPRKAPDSGDHPYCEHGDALDPVPCIYCGAPAV